MHNNAEQNKALLNELNTVRLQLEEANETITAIRTGKIDALLVHDGSATQVFTLQSADQTYRVFIEKMNEGAVTINREGFIIYCNSRFSSIIEVPLAKITGLAFDTFISAGYKERYSKIVELGWQSESKGEIYLRSSTNESIPFLISVTAVEIMEGVALSLLLTDLSVQKENERQLKIKNDALEEAQLATRKLNLELENKVNVRTKDLLLSRERFKFLADNIPVIVWTADHNGNFDYANQQWYEYTGLNFEGTEKGRWVVVLHADDVARTAEEWSSSVEKKTPFRVEYRIRRASDGMYRWHICNAMPFKNDENVTIAWFATCTDIHDQKLALEKKEEFIGIASHELKTPLTSLKAYMQIIDLHKEHFPQNLYTYFTKAYQSVNKLQNLIADLLDASKIQAGRLQFTTGVLDMDKLISACIESLQHIYPDFTIIKKSVPGLVVLGNTDRLEQVIVNLIDNAVKYSLSQKELIISALKVKDTVRVTVTDFGVGLSPENKEKIFERFFRVEEFKYKTGGLGMGLYISSEIIKLHNGFMDVESQLDKGAAFSFSLPAM